MSKKLLYNVQLAHHHHDESEDKNHVTLEEFLDVLNDFPWKEQISKFNEYQRVSPTLSLKTPNYVIWFSAYIESDDIEYIIGLIEIVEKKKIFSREMKKIENHFQIETADFEDLITSAEIFFDADYENLKSQLK